MSVPVDATTAALAQLHVDDPKIQQNLHKLHHSHQHTFLPWKHLSAAHLTLLASQSPLQRRESVRSILSLATLYPGPSGEDSQRAEIVIDLTLSILSFCWAHSLSALKSSTFFSVVYVLHGEACFRPGGGKLPSVGECWARFEALLLRHALERPPFSICCFSQPDVVLLSGWARSNYFAQIRLYQYAFGTANELDLRVTNSVAEQVDPEKVGTSLWSVPAADDGASTEFSLDHARNYYEANPGAATNDDPDSVPAESGSEAWKDDSLVAAELLAQSAAAPLPQAQSDVASLLPDPEDQALFNAAVARELASLQRDLQDQLKKQADAFTQRLAELEPKLDSSPAALLTPGNISARGSGVGLQTNVPPAKERSRSRGKQ